MKSLIVVSLVGASVLLGLPAGAQQMPPPYAPPVSPQLQQPQVPPQLQQPQVQQVPDAQGDGLPLPAGDETVVLPGAEPQQGYDPNVPNPANAAEYPPADLGADNEIAQSYDDGYDAQAYSQFQTALAPYGGWDYDSSYGYVWSPSASIVGTGFSPYATGGNWALTEYGWTWVSDWSWGWAPFHYGRWITRAGRWSWVPGSMWGPAWVSWRSGGGYVGWSPLPPRGVRLAGGTGAGSPWRFAPAASLGAARPTFVSSRYLPGMFARTTVVSNDRLLTRGSWSVHVNAGPTRGITARPVSLSRVAPGALPRVAVYPHPGLSLNARPWTRTTESRADVLNNQGWHAGTPAAQPHTVGRAPAYGSSPAARAEVRGPSAGWSQRPASTYGSAGGYGHSYNSGWSAPAPRPSYGAPNGYGAPSAYGAQNAYRAPAAAPAYRAPAPAFHAPAPSYSPAPRSFAPSYAPPSGGGSHFGSSGGGSHFGPAGGGHVGGFGGGGRRR